MHGIVALIVIVVIIRAIINTKARGPRKAPGHAVVWWIFFGPSSLFFVPMIVSGEPLWMAAGSAFVITWLGLIIANQIFARLGLRRLAMTFAFLGALPFRLEVRSDVAIAGARACIALRRRRGSAPAEALRRIEARINVAPTLTANLVVASGLLAIARGDRDRGRALLASAAELPGLRRLSRNLATRWLVADAASRGDWAELIVLGSRFKTRLTRFATEVAARLSDGSYQPTHGQLVWRWLLAPARLSTLGLLRKALAHVPQASVAADAPIFARHIAALKGSISDDALVKLATDWESEREKLPFEASLAIDDDLAAIGAERPQLAGRHPAFNAAGGKNDPQSDLEIAITALRHRHDDKRDLPAIEEWAEYTMLRELYAKAATDAVRQRLAYQTAHWLIGNHAVHLQNVRLERGMAFTMYDWLQREARLAGDETFIAHYMRNAATCRI